MRLLQTITNRRRRVAGAVAAGVVALVPFTPLAPGAGAEPAPPQPGLGAVDASGGGLAAGSEVVRRTDPSEDGSGAFVYDNGRFRSLAGVRGAALTGHLGINDRGVVAGTYVDAAGSFHGFLQRRSGRMTTIDVRGAASTLVFDVDNRGRVVGGYLDAQGVLHGFLRASDGTVTEIDAPGAAQTVIFGLNDRGHVVGVTFDAQGAITGGFVWQRGHFRRIRVPGADPATPTPTGINNRGQIVGTYRDPGVTRGPDGYPPNSFHGFVWDGEVTRVEPPGSIKTQAWGIHDRGVVSGSYTDPQRAQHGFVFARGRFRVIDAPGDRAGTGGAGINNRGDVVVPDPTAVALSGVSQ